MARQPGHLKTVRVSVVLRQTAGDGDLLPDGWEVLYGTYPLACNSASSSGWDTDGDGLGLFDEYRYCTSQLPVVQNTCLRFPSGMGMLGGRSRGSSKWEMERTSRFVRFGRIIG